MTDDLSGFAAREAGGGNAEHTSERSDAMEGGPPSRQYFTSFVVERDGRWNKVAMGNLIRCQNCKGRQAYVQTDTLECMECGQWIIKDGVPLSPSLAATMDGGGGEACSDDRAFAQRVLEVFQRVRPESTIVRQEREDDIVIRVGAGRPIRICEYDNEQVGIDYWGNWYSEIPFDDIEENLKKVLPRIAPEIITSTESAESCKPRTFADACRAFQDAPRTTADDIADVCDSIRDMLLEKNRKYGDSALEPVRIFSRASAEEQILVRLDDKLSRLRSAQSDEDEDVIDDLIGYLVLLKIARSR